MPDIDKQLLEELKQTVGEHLDPLRTAIEEEKTARGEITAETKAAVERVNDRLDQLEADAKKAALVTQRADAARERTEEQKAFEVFVRKSGAGADEVKALQVGDDTGAGFLAPTEFVDEMLKGVVEFSPMRQLVRVLSTSASSVKFPKRTGSVSARWVGETETKTTSEPSVGLEEIPTHELYAMVDVSNWLLEDASFDIEGWLREEVAEQFGVAEGTAFVTGNGSKKPEGILDASSGIDASLETAASNVIAGDDLIKLFFSLKGAYTANAQWVMNRTTIRDVRLLKDAVNGNYLWQAGLSGLAPATILDRPYNEAPDMPLASVDNAKVIAFGDFRRGYVAVDRIQTAVQRDPYTQAADGMVRFIFRRRLGGQTVVPEAIKILKAKA